MAHQSSEENSDTALLEGLFRRARRLPADAAVRMAQRRADALANGRMSFDGMTAGHILRAAGVVDGDGAAIMDAATPHGEVLVGLFPARAAV